MSIDYQIYNIFHNILSHSSKKLVVNTVFSDSLFDISMGSIPNYIFVDHSTIKQKLISYGITVINNPLVCANNIKEIQQMYANKLILFHDNSFFSLKKEDQFILYNQIKNYHLLSFVPQNDSFGSKQINRIKYGFVPSIINNASQRNINVLILYNQNKRQANILYELLKQTIPQVELCHIKNLKTIDAINSTFNNTKICIDLTSYYNMLHSVSCGCLGVTINESYDPDFIITVQNVNDMSNSIKELLNSYNDLYIDAAKTYIKTNYSYDNFTSSIDQILQQLSNTAITL